MSFATRRHGLSGTPLAALPAAALDCETTGLRPAEDRVVELAAVRLDAGELDASPRLASLVRPDIPIPASATAIHGIGDDEVGAAPDFRAAMHELSAFAGDAVIVGYAIGFDLAVLEAEHKRHGLDWSAPRSLDIRHLVEALAPILPDHSLETVAAWLNVAVEDRHRALGDALTAARIFHALLPKLRSKGIVTLAQAERACRSLSARLAEEGQAGWQPIATAPADPAIGRHIDSHPYRHRVAEAMTAPAVIVEADMPVGDALARMLAGRLSSVLVAPQIDGADHGILTERDILRSVATSQTALQDPVDRHASRPLICVDQGEFLYRAALVMSAQGFRHLGVKDGNTVVGALSAGDLLNRKEAGVELLGSGIGNAGNAAALARVWSQLATVAGTLVAEDVDARTIAAIVSRELRALTARACELAEAALRDAGMGPPPVRYAMLVLGSGGRGESLLAMDQDNAIVFEEGEPDGTSDRWFAELGTCVSDILDEAGVRYCDGGVMASHAQWRHDRDGWRRTVADWLSRTRPEDILFSDIFFDATPVHGEAAMADDLLREAVSAAGAARSYLQAMAMSASDRSSALGWFGRLRLSDGRADLKRHGLLPIFSTARVVALRYGIAARSTKDRLLAARDRNVAGSHVVDPLLEAHRIFLDAILRQQLRDLEAGIALSNRVAPSQLSSHDHQELRWALRQVDSIADLLGTPDFA